MNQLLFLLLLAQAALIPQMIAGDGPAAPPPAGLSDIQHEPAPAPCTRLEAEDFVPLTLSERLAEGLQSVTGPKAVIMSVFRAAINQGMDSPPEWGQGSKGFAYRLGTAYGGRFIGQSLEHSTALLLHEDNRYFISGETGFKRRLKYAILSAFLARHDDGSRHLSISAIGAAAGSSFIARAWQPPSTASAGDAAVAFGVGMAYRVGLNAAREFIPARLARFLP
ncbi:MAG: hypothetical protein U0Q18_35840 [Bryobacteraceae bacterium]